MLSSNFIKEKISKGLPIIGIWSIINSPLTVDIAGHAGLDFQILDMEHGIADFSALDNCIRACESVGCSPLVRVPELRRAVIQSCLDLGAHGIIVPQVKGYDDALEVVQATKFAPIGSRGFNPFTRAGGYNPSLPFSSTKLNNHFSLTSIIIETKGAITELDRILTIPELDMFYLGVYDLSFAFGLEGQVNHPDILDLVATAIKKIKNAGKLISLMVKNEIEMQKYIELGVQLIVYGVDTDIYYSAIGNKIAQFRQHIG